MNVMHVVKMATKFMSNPEAAVSDLENETIIPGWKELEKNVGGKVNLVIMETDGHINVHVYKTAANNGLDYVDTYTLSQLMKILKSKTLPDGNITTAALPAPEPIATSTSEPAATDGADGEAGEFTPTIGATGSIGGQ